jgi:hypothetical protein
MSLQNPENVVCSYCGGLGEAYNRGNYLYCFCRLCNYSWTERLNNNNKKDVDDKK